MTRYNDKNVTTVCHLPAYIYEALIIALFCVARALWTKQYNMSDGHSKL